MTHKNEIPTIAPLHYQYSSLQKESIQEDYKLFPISYKSKEIAEYEVLFFHCLMKKNYGDPAEFEPLRGSVKELEDGRVMAWGGEWKYYIRTDSGGIIQVGTEDYHTLLKICHVLPSKQNEPSSGLILEGEKFIDDLLKEAQRLKDQILNIRKEFENDQNKNIKVFFLDNVYLTNYRSTELMLEYAEDNESIIRDECLRYDARDELTSEQHAHLDRFMAGIGMYLGAAISYFFMALEGFINVLYYAFLKNELRSEFFNEQKLDERLDISTKVLLMPSLCDGFKTEQTAGFLKDLTRLKKYRNLSFHSKISDSLIRVGFLESGFLYQCGLKENSSASLPSLRIHLKGSNVLEFKKIVDSIVKNILDMMQEDSKSLVENWILNKLHIPFWKDENGAVKLGML